MAHLPGHSEAAVSEYRTDTGELRPLYADVMAALDGMGDEGMRQRWRQAKREVALDAFSFALDPKEFRPVPSDWIPRLIDIDEWQVIKAGVEQRMKALNLFLLDLYTGKQGSRAGRCGLFLPILLPGVPRLSAGEGCVRAYLRHRPRSAERRAICHSRRQPADTVRHHISVEVAGNCQLRNA